MNQPYTWVPHEVSAGSIQKGQSGRPSCSRDLPLTAAGANNEHGDVTKGSLALQGSSPSRDIKRIDPSERISGQNFNVRGYVSDVHTGRSPRPLTGLGGLGQRIADKVIGNRHSQITIITRDFESFTALVDLRQVIVAQRDIVSADLRTAFVATHPFFLCDRLELCDQFERRSIKRENSTRVGRTLKIQPNAVECRDKAGQSPAKYKDREVELQTLKPDRRAGDPTDVIRSILKGVGAVELKSKKHRKFELPNGAKFVMSCTPSDFRAPINQLKVLERLVANLRAKN